MYEEFYGFNKKPFSKTPDPEFLYLSRTHEEALARLHYAVEEKEIVLLTGEVGSGKTTITRALMDNLDESKYKVVLILNPRLSPLQFLKIILKRFEAEPVPSNRQELTELIYERLYHFYNSGIVPVIIIDEAQLLSDRRVYEEMRLLSNFQLDKENLLSLILVAQPDIKKRIRNKLYLPLRQRIGLYYHIGPLTEEEVKEYINFRLLKAGRREPLFTDEAIKRIYLYSGGIPRVINNIANASLIEGMGREAFMIDHEIVEAAARELELIETNSERLVKHALRER
ncbi:MAG: AAA family ATPase [Thermodesulfovibrionales bacterium]|nr:AAA family ATPase [Thermodesulfovibrionales bacterium]